jgi:hypothetical protein
LPHFLIQPGIWSHIAESRHTHPPSRTNGAQAGFLAHSARSHASQPLVALFALPPHLLYAESRITGTSKLASTRKGNRFRSRCSAQRFRVYLRISRGVPFLYQICSALITKKTGNNRRSGSGLTRKCLGELPSWDSTFFCHRRKRLAIVDRPCCHKCTLLQRKNRLPHAHSERNPTMNDEHVSRGGTDMVRNGPAQFDCFSVFTGSALHFAASRA